MNREHRTNIVTRCNICDQLKVTNRHQRGVTHIEWVRVCADCERKIYKRNFRNPRPRSQLDLFAK